MRLLISFFVLDIVKCTQLNFSCKKKAKNIFTEPKRVRINLFP